MTQTSLTVFYGAAKPVRIRGVNCVKLASFAMKYPGWHSNAQDRATIRALTSLVRLGCIVRDNTRTQFRWTYPE